MHRCSDSIGAIAAALANAQTELTNPEKSQRRNRLAHQLHPAAAIAAGWAWLKAEHAKLVWARRGHTLRDDLLGLASASPARQRPLQR